MSLFRKIQKYIEMNSGAGSFQLQDDGNGPFISKWDVNIDQPTLDLVTNISVPDISYIDKRKKEYGSVEKQIEFITENGLEAWQEKVALIKSQYPKGD